MKLTDYLTDYVEHAFRGVSLGPGLSIYAAMSLEAYGDPTEDRLDLSAERIDWRRVPQIDIIRRDQAIHFLDDDGFRFYTPAILTILIDPFIDCGMLADTFEFTLAGIRSSCRVRERSYCEVFTAAQRSAILRYVKFLNHNLPGYAIDDGLVRTENKLPRCCQSNAKTG